jgi:peptide/nickel transport system ATP-binding protein
MSGGNGTSSRQRSAAPAERTYNIRIGTPQQQLVAIDAFSIRPDTITFLFGESGIGKSLIAKAIYGLIDPEELQVTVNGEAYPEYAARPETRECRDLGFFVFQEPSTHLDPLLRLGEQLREGSLEHAPSETAILSGLWDTAAYGAVQDLLRIYPKPDRPSGGEKQRMLLAMAFKKLSLLKENPAQARKTIFVFDEPSGNLDNHFRDQFLGMLFDFRRAFPFTAAVITHDYSMISSINRRQSDMLSVVSYKELFKRKDEIALRDFQPSSYIRWIDAMAPVASAPRPTLPILQFESGAQVYGRTLTISRDPAGAERCSLELYPGTLASLKAPSGTGKTTLVKMIMGMSPTARFQMQFCGETVSERTPRSYWKKNLWGKLMTMVFQHADEALNPNASVKDVFQGLSPSAVKELLAAWFTDDIDAAFLNKRVRFLSGGEKQRLNLLRSLSLQTDLVILDEPLNGLDFESMTRVLEMLRTNQGRAQAVLIISHNDDVFDRLAAREHTYYLHAGMGG